MADDPRRFYECLLDYCSASATVDRIGIGLVWTVCQSRHHDGVDSGLAMSPVAPVRTLAWPGTLAGKALQDIGRWVLEWEPYQAGVGMAAINCSLNSTSNLPGGETLSCRPGAANLAVFDHFQPQLAGKKVVVIGHYPGIERFVEQYGWRVLERTPVAGDYPDPAAEFMLPEADWVFLSATTIVNKTFPRLAQLSAGATTVLMGPTLPWLPQLHEFGVDYLAGVETIDADRLYRTAMEGGGVRIFETGVRYRVVELTPSHSMDWLKQRIATSFSDKQRYTDEMEQWYGSGKRERYPGYAELDLVNRRLSRLDSSYKTLWDQHARLTRE